MTEQDIIKRYGKPILRFKPSGNFTHEEKMSGDIPEEVMVVKIKHVSELMVFRNTCTLEHEWIPNYGERWVIRELLRRLEENK